MPKLIDLTGRRFGKWLVLHRAIKPNARSGNAYWLCRCDCGTLRPVVGSTLGKASNHCGCSNPRMRATGPKPFVLFNGRKYTEDVSNGYWRAHRTKTYLHRDIWEAHNGPIPAGFDVHHKDEDKAHNELSNFECLSNRDHSLRYSAVRKSIELKKCESCGVVMQRTHKQTGDVVINPAAYERRRFCSMACSAKAVVRQKPKKGLTHADYETIAHLCESGVPRLVIAATYGVSLTMIQYARRKAQACS